MLGIRVGESGGGIWLHLAKTDVPIIKTKFLIWQEGDVFECECAR